jgi:hypothetical protein
MGRSKCCQYRLLNPPRQGIVATPRDAGSAPCGYGLEGGAGGRAGWLAWRTPVAGTAPVEPLDLPWGWDQLDRLAAQLAEWASGVAAA